MKWSACTNTELRTSPVNGVCIRKSILLNKNMMDTLSKKYKITALKHVNPNNTSVFAHYKCSVFTDSADRMYFFFKTSYNNITSFVLCKDLSLGICIINDPIPFKTFMKCFNENAYYFLKRKYPENKKNEEKE